MENTSGYIYSDIIRYIQSHRPLNCIIQLMTNNQLVLIIIEDTTHFRLRFNNNHQLNLNKNTPQLFNQLLIGIGAILTRLNRRIDLIKCGNNIIYNRNTLNLNNLNNLNIPSRRLPRRRLPRDEENNENYPPNNFGKKSKSKSNLKSDYRRLAKF